MNDMTPPLEKTPQPETSAPLFHADSPGGQGLADYPALDLLADLCVHRQAQTPLTIGVFGVPGAGKTHALRAIARRASALAEAAQADGPFCDSVVAVEVHARDLQADASGGLAHALHEALIAQGPQSAAAQLDAKAMEDSTDPLAAAQEAGDKLGEMRQRLAAEQRNLEELQARRTGLNEALLLGATNTQVDAYARRHRKQIDAALKDFGFSGDAVAVFKELLRERIDHPGRLRSFVHSMLAYMGQAKLLVWAVALFLLGWAFDLAERMRGDWLVGLRNAAENAAPQANWIEAHAQWFAYLSQAAITVGLLCLALNIWRAARFTLPLLHGERLHEADAGQRRSELDQLIAAHTNRADQLGEEAATLANLAQMADRRARERAASHAPHRHAVFAGPPTQRPGRSADAYLDALQMGLSAQGAPQRILVFLDGLEALPAPQATAVVDGAHQCLRRPGFVLAMAADAEQLALGWGGGAQASLRLERYVQAPFTIRMIRDQQTSVAYAHQLLGASAQHEPRPLDAASSALDHPLKPIETHLLGKLASLAGDTPRAVKRYLNCWRLARPMTIDGGALALMLALDQGASAGELAAMGAAMDLEEPGAPLTIHPGEPRLIGALAAVNALRSSPLTNGQAHAAWMIARDYSIPDL